MQPLPIISQTVETTTRTEMIDVTDQIQKLIRQVLLQDGFLIVQVPHTTAGITINEHADPDVKHDILRKLDALVPQMEAYYQHDEGNSDAHVKTSFIGNSVTLLVESGRLVLGRWQGVFLCEFDGPRERRMNVKMVNLVLPSA
jgi:secondary thiamine-phosphate synthase enzyme